MISQVITTRCRWLTPPWSPFLVYTPGMELGQLVGCSPGPDLRGSRPQASHRQRASHQTLHMLFLAHDSCLRNRNLVLMHACVTRIGSARQFHRPVHCFSRPKDYKLISYWLVSLAALVAWQLPRHSLIRTQMISTIHLLTSCHFAKFADIFKDDEPGNISCTNWLLIRVCRTLLPNVALPQTPLGELQRSPRPCSWFRGWGPRGKGRGREGREGCPGMPKSRVGKPTYSSADADLLCQLFANDVTSKGLK